MELSKQTVNRICHPQKGDRFVKGSLACEVLRVSKKKKMVYAKYYGFFYRGNNTTDKLTFQDWRRLVVPTVENGATFCPRGKR